VNLLERAAFHMTEKNAAATGGIVGALAEEGITQIEAEEELAQIEEELA
jgi:hypothetical protein